MSLMGGSRDWDELVSEASKKQLVIDMGMQILAHGAHPDLIKIYEQLCAMYDIHPVTKPMPTLEDYGRSIKIKL